MPEQMSENLDMFREFNLEMFPLGEATLRVRHGGSGPPLLLLHGHPRTHTTWHWVAPMLAETFTVVCPDLRGFGQSSTPRDATDHAGSSKRAKAHDCVALMQNLGHDEFSIVGHDRGSYTAFRTAMDHPQNVRSLSILDGVPILEALERCDARFAKAWWHWFFFAQPEKPERAIMADPLAWYGGSAEKMGQENFEDYFRAIHDPKTVHGMVEDYRAGLELDWLHDEDDRKSGRRLACPLQVLWSKHDDMEILYGDVLEVWQPWATELCGHSLPCGHHMAEEVPGLLAKELGAFHARCWSE